MGGAWRLRPVYIVRYVKAERLACARMPVIPQLHSPERGGRGINMKAAEDPLRLKPEHTDSPLICSVSQ